MNPANAVATFPILQAGWILLKLRKLLLQTALYRFAFLQGDAEFVEPRRARQLRFSNAAKRHRCRQTPPRHSSSIALPMSTPSKRVLTMSPTFFPLPISA